MNIKSDRFDKQIGTMIRSLRKEHGINQEEMGAALGLHQTAICRVEQGRQKLSPFQLMLFCKRLNIKIGDVLK